MAAAKYAQSAILLGALALTVVLYSPRLVAQGGVGITVNEEDSRQILTLQHSTALMTAAAEVPEHIIVVGASAVDPRMLDTDESQIAIRQNDVPILGVADAGETLILDGSAVAGRPSTVAKERIVVSGADDVETLKLGVLTSLSPTPTAVSPLPTDTPTELPTSTAVSPTSTDTPPVSTEASTASTDVPPTPTDGYPTNTVASLTSTVAAPKSTDTIESPASAMQVNSANEKEKGWLSEVIIAAIITAIAAVIAAIITAWAMLRQKESDGQSGKPERNGKND